jgi:CDK5 regulatory subunit-associated protein 3
MSPAAGIQLSIPCKQSVGTWAMLNLPAAEEGFELLQVCHCPNHLMDLSKPSVRQALFENLAPPELQAVGVSAVGEQLTAVEGAIGALSGERLKQLLLVRCSRQHRARLARHLQQAASKESKFKQ